MFALPGIPTFQYLPQAASTHSPGAKSMTNVPIHVSPTQPPTGGATKRQAMDTGSTSSMRAGGSHRAGGPNLGRPPCTLFVMTPPTPTVLGHRPNEQTQRESCREIL